ncbi:helix-turn-helix domain-containing protein [Plantactinospora sp. CA-290183]|uniref:helix-turn-helix domain-containing protein n=1 Tax=Plantactinospora sp. CA-290183 TaxID=3240006 RepID=UPI003D8CDBDA
MTSFSTGGRSMTPGAVIRRARMQRGRGWTQYRLAHEMARVANAYGLDSPSLGCLRSMISRWENGHRKPDEVNRRLLCEALGIPLEHLMMPIDEDIPWPPVRVE